MDVQNMNIFLEALVCVLEQYGVEKISKANIIKKEIMNVDMDITALIGLTGKVRGNVAYSFGTETGIKFISKKLEKEVKKIDSIGRFTIEELANEITNKAREMFLKAEKSFNITAPSLVFGKDIIFVISSVDTISVDIDTSFGRIQVNLGLEG